MLDSGIDRVRTLGKTGAEAVRKKARSAIGAKQPAPTGRRIAAVAGAAAGGALLAFLLDPANGKRRRNVLVDRTAGAVRTAGRRTGRVGRWGASGVYGTLQKVRHLRDGSEPPANDQTLEAKVESEVLGQGWVPKGQINVNVERGVVVLRGTVNRPRDARRLERQVRKVRGVRDVRSLLHPPSSPAPLE